VPPIYMLEVALGDASERRLIEAKTEAGAVKHAAHKYIKKVERIFTADQIKEMAGLAARGVPVETSTAE
jgi:hypothetical protein